MEIAEKTTTAQKALEQGQGVLRLAPTWVPRHFAYPAAELNYTRMTITCWADSAANR
jgi:hypothetical protein